MTLRLAGFLGLEACEYQMRENTTDRDGLELTPKEYFKRQIYASFWFENEGVPHAIERLGADNIMFETDYPHPTCLYPAVREQVQTCLGGLDAGVQRKILHENAARVYGIELPRDENRAAAARRAGGVRVHGGRG